VDLLQPLDFQFGALAACAQFSEQLCAAGLDPRRIIAYVLCQVEGPVRVPACSGTAGG